MIEARMLFELSTQIVLLLVLAAFVAGFVDAIAGGGGLITIPALVLAGLPPVQALGTNKLQGIFATAAATASYAKAGYVDLRGQLPAFGFAFAGSALGAVLATIVPAQGFLVILPPLLVAIALYFALKPSLGDVDRAQRIGSFAFSVSIVPLIGFYDGVFGPGTGSFLMLAFVGLAGYGLLKATAHTKLLNFASNLAAFIVFVGAGAVVWKTGLAMGLAQFAGARLGAAFAMKKGARLIKPLLVVVCLTLAVRLLMDSGHPLRLLAGF